MYNKLNKALLFAFLPLLVACLMLINVHAGTTPSSLAYDPATGILYVTNSSGNTVFVVNAPTNTVISSIIVGSNPSSIAINPQNTLAYVANNGGGTISVISLATNKVVKTITGANSPDILAFNPSGTTAYVTEGGNDVVSVINVASNTITNSIGLEYSCGGMIINGVAFTPDGTKALVASGCNGGSGSTYLDVINVATNTISVNIALSPNDNPQGVAASPTGGFAYVSTGYDNGFDVVNLGADTFSHVTTGAWPSAIAFNPSGTLAYQSYGDGSGSVAVINAAGNTVLTTIGIGNQGGGGPVPSAIAFSASGSVAWATNFGSGTVSVINVASNAVINTITMEIPPVPTLSLANSLISGSIDLVIGSASDNALITATCASGDTCQIDNAANVELASGTTTATLAYNALASGYSTLYANDLTNGYKSANAYVRRISEANALRLTFTNTEPYAEPGNASLIVRFNASKYSSIESNSLNNTAMAFNNGTVAYSWLEGNSSGEQNPANQLSQSSNVVYWFKTPASNSFLQADTGNVITNSILLIFGSTSNNLLDGNFIGEAPQLSCSNGNAMTCIGTYAKYDNGQSIFTYYTNFAGSTVPGGWSTIETADLAVDNGISFTGAGTGGEQAQMTMNTAYARPISIDVLSEVLGANPVYDIGYANNTGAFTGGYQISGKDADEFDVYIATPLVDTHDGTPVAYATVASDVWNPVTLGIGPLSIHDEVGYVPFSSYNDTTYNNYYPFFGSWWTDKTVYAQWFRVRNSYDSNVSLSPPYVTPVDPTAPTISLAGSATNTITVIEGTSEDNGLITANCYPADVCEIYDSNGVVLASNITFVKIPYNSLAIGSTTLYANDITANLLSNYSYINRNPAASMSPISPSTQTVTKGQSATISGNGISNGISPYYYQWYAAYGNVPTATSANATNANVILGTGTTSGEAQSQNAIFQTNSITQTGTYYFTLYGADSSPTTVNSTSVNVIVTVPSQGGSQSSTSGLPPQTSTVGTTILGSTTTVPPTTTAPATTTIRQNNIINITINQPQNTTQLCNGTQNVYNVKYPSIGTTLTVNPKTSSCIEIIAVNVTSTTNVQNSNLSKVIEVNITLSSSNATVNATLSYPCSINSSKIIPFILENGTWNPIEPFGVNAAACTVSFAIPDDPIIGLFTAASSFKSTPVIVSKSAHSGILLAAIAVIVIILVLAAMYLLFGKRKRQKKN